MDKVYRICHTVSRMGPYNTDPAYIKCDCEDDDHEGCLNEQFRDWLFDATCSDDRHPHPALDGIGYIYDSSLVFGFRTRDDLDRWFDAEEQRLLRDCGFSIMVFRALRVVEGGHQVAFVPHGDGKPIDSVRA